MDIGAPGLGGPNSGAFGVNGRSQVVGQAETSSLDPNGEDFCGYGTHLICLPFLWQYGVMLPLPTLEGNNGGTNRINNRGEVVGYAENATPDQTCPGAVPQVLQERPVIWKNGEIHELPTFPGDPDGFAFGINDNGQAVGASGICATLNPDTLVYVLARHALLWDQGTVTDLGNLGGTGSFGPGNFAHDVNSQGQVVGASDLPGDATFHGFLWTRETGIQDIGTLPGDFASAALGISDGGEVAGVSLDANFNLRAFLRQNGVMTDLNTLVPADSPLFLLLADVINPRGEIEGFAFDTETAEVHGFLATPTNSVAATEGSSPAALGGTSKAAKVVLTENARKLLQHRLRFRLPGAQLTAPQ